MNLEIVPYKSVGPIAFGMTPKEVEKHLGPAEDVQGNPIPESASQELQDRYAGDFSEFRLGASPEEAKPTVLYRNGLVVSLELYDTNVETEIDGYRIFEHSKRSVIERLIGMSSEYIEGVDMYIFTELGISTSSDEMWDYSPSINVFSTGEFDGVIARGIDDGDYRRVRK